VDRYHQVLERVAVVPAVVGRPADGAEVEGLVDPAEVESAADPVDVESAADPAEVESAADPVDVESAADPVDPTQPADPTDESPDLAALEAAGARQADLLARVHEICLVAHALAPSDGEDIPPGPGGILLDVHPALTRAATLVAQAAESLTIVLVTVTAGRPEEAIAATLGARRATEQADIHVARAEAILRRREADEEA
jgi:hypothetical protein